jgi:hypothetical protein
VIKFLTDKYGVSTGFLYRYVPRVKALLQEDGLALETVNVRSVIERLQRKDELSRDGVGPGRGAAGYYKLVLLVKCLQLWKPHYTTDRVVELVRALCTEEGRRRHHPTVVAACSEGLAFALDHPERITETLVSTCRKAAVRSAEIVGSAEEGSRGCRDVVPPEVYAYFRERCVPAFPFLSNMQQERDIRLRYLKLLGKSMVLKKAGAEYTDPHTNAYQGSQREKFVRDILPQLLAEECSFLDECSVALNTVRPYGWAMTGDRAILKQSEQRESITKVMAAISYDADGGPCVFMAVLPPVPQRLTSLRPDPFDGELAYWLRCRPRWRTLGASVARLRAVFELFGKPLTTLGRDARNLIADMQVTLRRQVRGQEGVDAHLFEGADRLSSEVCELSAGEWEDLVLSYLRYDTALLDHLIPHNLSYEGVDGGTLFGHGHAPWARAGTLPYERQGALYREDTRSRVGGLTMEQEEVIDVLRRAFSGMSYMDIFRSLFMVLSSSENERPLLQARLTILRGFLDPDGPLYNSNMAHLVRDPWDDEEDETVAIESFLREAAHKEVLMKMAVRGLYTQLGIQCGRGAGVGLSPDITQNIGKRSVTLHMWLVVRYCNDERPFTEMVERLGGNRAGEVLRQAYEEVGDSTFGLTVGGVKGDTVTFSFVTTGARQRGGGGVVSTVSRSDMALFRRLGMVAVDVSADDEDMTMAYVDFEGSRRNDKREHNKLVAASGRLGGKIVMGEGAVRISGVRVSLDPHKGGAVVDELAPMIQAKDGGNSNTTTGGRVFWGSLPSHQLSQSVGIEKVQVTWTRRFGNKEQNSGAPPFEVDRWIFREFVRSLPRRFVENKTLLMDRASVHMYPTQQEVACNQRMPYGAQYFVDSELSVLALDLRCRGGGDGAPWGTTVSERANANGLLRRPAVVFTPSYTPQLNPIESFFNVLKGYVRREVMDSTRSRKNLSHALWNCARKAIDPSKALNYMKCAGYRSTQAEGDVWVQTSDLDRQLHPRECVGVHTEALKRRLASSADPRPSVEAVKTHREISLITTTKSIRNALLRYSSTAGRSGTRQDKDNLNNRNRRDDVEKGRACPVMKAANVRYGPWLTMALVREGQIPRQRAVTVEGGEEWYVADILSHRLERDGSYSYEVVWEADGSRSYEPERNLTTDGKYENTVLSAYKSARNLAV